MTVIVRRATADAITLPRRLMHALKLREGDEVKAIVDGETLRLAHLDQFLSLRGALANDEGFDEALRTLQEARASVEYTRAAVQAALGSERLPPDTPFVDDLTLGQYLDLPDDRRARLWDKSNSF